MAKKTHNVITDLVELVGEETAVYILGVHKNTIYKWTVPSKKKDRRIPNSAAQTLAAHYIYLIQTCGWTVQDLETATYGSNEILSCYA